ncbi:MAG: twitching motility protein PilT [Lachnospiraceae bacterium]|nr:twitching motility protein PilT [Lachnospiraceae bacterium]
MVQLILGQKGKGKTKFLLDKVNEAITGTNGNIVFLDKNTKHMYELNNKIRLIDVSSYELLNEDEFVGFISGILSQDHDLEQMYFDCFLQISGVGDGDVTPVLKRLQTVSENFGVDFYICISRDKSEISADFSDNILVAL